MLFQVSGALRCPGETYSDVILKAGQERSADRPVPRLLPSPAGLPFRYTGSPLSLIIIASLGPAPGGISLASPTITCTPLRAAGGHPMRARSFG